MSKLLHATLQVSACSAGFGTPNTAMEAGGVADVCDILLLSCFRVTPVRARVRPECLWVPLGLQSTTHGITMDNDELTSKR